MGLCTINFVYTYSEGFFIFTYRLLVASSGVFLQLLLLFVSNQRCESQCIMLLIDHDSIRPRQIGFMTLFVISFFLPISLSCFSLLLWFNLEQNLFKNNNNNALHLS